MITQKTLLVFFALDYETFIHLDGNHNWTKTTPVARSRHWRKDWVENFAVAGEIEGKQSRGTQKLTYMSSLSKWVNMSKMELLQPTRD